MKKMILLTLILTALMLLLCIPAQAGTVTITSDTTQWTDGNTYVAEGEVTIESRVMVSGDVTLSLSEGCTLTCSEGIEVNKFQQLTIEGSGSLIATASLDNAGIGSGEGAGRTKYAAGTIIINGGNITAEGGLRSAGIGAGSGGEGGTVIINGGVVNATGHGQKSNDGGAGIGGSGGNANYGGIIIINGGVVNATGNTNAAGIGGGGCGRTVSDRASGADITINGGIITARGEGDASGIGGGGLNGCGGNITINGGRVTAIGGSSGAGIGHSAHGVPGTITLGWTEAGDFIQASSYSGEIIFAEGKYFSLESTGAPANAENIAGQKIVPAAGSVSVRSEADWNAACAAVAAGQTNLNVFLDADVSLSAEAAMMGAGGYPFSGHFEGRGHTLTVHISADGAAAPFRQINGATISNLKIAGSVSGGQHCAGLAGGVNGTNTIRNCEVSASISTSESHCGGFIGHGGTSSTTLSGCVFSGSISGATQAGTFWGWSDSGASPVLTDCLDLSSSTHPIGRGYPANPAVTSTYYTCAEKNTEGSRPWTNRGQLGYPVIPAEDVHIALDNVPGLFRNGMIYAAEGETVAFRLTNRFLDYSEYTRYVENKYVLTASAGELTKIDETNYTLQMPGSQVNLSIPPITGDMGDSIHWTLDASGLLVISGTGPMPDYHGGSSGLFSLFAILDHYPPVYEVVIEEGITRIGAETFSLAYTIRKITLPNTLESIGYRAFTACHSLESITLPEGLKEIGDSAFAGCRSLKTIHTPSGMEYIGIEAFNGCNALESFTGSAKTIERWAFMHCSSLKTVVFEPGQRKIGDRVFYYCSNLESVRLPEGLTEIDDRAFWIYEPDSWSNFVGYRQQNTKLTGITLPSTLKKVGESAFAGAQYDIILTDGIELTDIGDWAFTNCTGLSGVLSIAENASRIGKYAFYNCAGLTGPLVVGEKATVIGPYAFYQCTGLTGLTLPENVSTYALGDVDSIGEYAFYGCTGLTGNLTLREESCSVGAHAFEGCTGLTGITIKDIFSNGGWIRSEAFAGCTGLESIEISACEGIGSGAFRNCTGLVSAVLPDAIYETLGDSVFAGCVSLESIHVPFSNEKDHYSDPSAHYVPASFCEGCTALDVAYLPSGTVEIRANAFSGCTSLTAVYIPADLQTIRQGAFRGCSQLSEVYFGGTEDQWLAVARETDNGVLENVEVIYGDYYLASGTLIVNESEHGIITLQLNRKRYSPGRGYGFGVTPDPGYHLAKLSAVDSQGQQLSIRQVDQSDNRAYIFRFQGQYVILSAVFEPDPVTSASSPYQLTAENFPLVLTEGWYELDESVTMKTRPQIQGNVKLHLSAGGVLNCRQGISVYEGNTLTVSGNGLINAAGVYVEAGIGASEDDACGTVIINGCTVISRGGPDGAGIGGAESMDGGTVIINGGTVHATGWGGAGLGGGRYSGGTVKILGGTIIAEGDILTNSDYPEAIGAGEGRATANPDVSIEIADGLMLTPLDGEAPALYSGRIAACAGTGVRIEACDHRGEIVLDNEGHTTCMLCGLAVSIDEAGTGSAASPWRIGSEGEWNALAQSIENGLDTSGKYFRLTNNISVSTMIGSEDHPFRGTLNGAGHTLTFTAADAPNDCAPFRYIQGAEISNLHIAGSIRTGNRWAAGLAANALGACSITNCRSSVTITSTHSGDGSHAGFVSVIAEGGSLTMNGCLFDGAITGTETTHCGGFVAYARNSVTIRNSLSAPSAYDAADSQNFVRWASGCTVTLENSCFLEPAVNNQGQRGYSVTAGEGVTLDFGLGTEYSVSGITAYSAGMVYEGVFLAGAGDTVSLTPGCDLPAEGPVVRYTASSGTLVLTDAGYRLTMAEEPSVISVRSDDLFEGSGTADNPWKIRSAEDWDTLATAENLSTAGKHFLLTGNISVTTMLGTGGNRFRGTFDGGGYILTVSLSAESAAAPFSAINGATIRNLRVEGTVTGGNHSAGLVAGAVGSNLIENCEISAGITCTGSHCGGIIGHGGSSDTTLRGCVFSGSTSGATRVGTLWGWSDSGARPTLEYCLDVSDSPYPVGLGYDDPSSSLICVYYTNPDKEAGISRPWRQPGKQAYTITAGEGVILGFGDGETFSVSGITPCGGAALKYGGVYYSGEEDIMGLYVELAEGYARPVSASAGEFAERGPGFCFLTMPATDVVISATPLSLFNNAGFRLPANLTRIEAEAFDGGAMTIVDIPASCVSIGDCAFRNSSLEMIRIPADCELGEDVFAGCAQVYVYAAFESDARAYCDAHDNCVYIEMAQN